MNGVDIAVALEVGAVKREDGVDRVDAHDGNQTGIIDLDALNAVVLDDPFPNRINRRDVLQQSQQAFNGNDFLKRFLMREAQPVQRYRTGSNIPKFSDVLGAEEDGILLPQQLRNGARGLRTEWVGRLSTAQENIGVNKDTYQ